MSVINFPSRKMVTWDKESTRPMLLGTLQAELDTLLRHALPLGSSKLPIDKHGIIKHQGFNKKLAEAVDLILADIPDLDVDYAKKKSRV